MISRWKRKRSGGDDGSSTILPSTYHSNDVEKNISPQRSSFRNRQMHGHGSINPNSVTCTNFLMGGQYYPGKDKQRRHLRRRTLWYRIFCSSNVRALLSVVVVIYISFVYCLLPGYAVIRQYGYDLSNESMGRNDGPGPAPIGTSGSSPTASLENELNELLDNAELQKRLKPLEVVKKEAKLLQEMIDATENSEEGLKRKKEFLQKVVPDFDMNASDYDKDGELKNSERTAQMEMGVLIQKEEQNKLQPSNYTQGSDSTESLRSLNNMPEHDLNSLCPSRLSSLSTTLVIQSTFDRIGLVMETCQRWTSSPIILVVYLKPNEETEMDSMSQDYADVCHNLKIIPYPSKSEKERNEEFPINKLRNRGLDHVETSHVLLLDIDFIPSTGLEYAIQAAIQDVTIELDDNNTNLDKNHAIVVPAFERKLKEPCKTLKDCHEYLSKNDDFVPKTMEGLKKCYEDGDCKVFQSDVNWEGHFSTQSGHWLKSSETSSVIPIQCFHSYRYEPWVVIPWCPLSTRTTSPLSPYYDERFFGYGKNKIQEIAHLRMKGFSFSVMPPTGFVTHYPHPDSRAKRTWSNVKDHTLHQQMDNLYSIYLNELNEKYGTSSDNVTPLCTNLKKVLK